MTTDTAKLKRPAGKLGAEKLTPEEQHRRFVEAKRASGASEDEADFNAIIRRIAKPKTKPAT